MWWDYAGFGRFAVVNELKSGVCGIKDGQAVQVPSAKLTKLTISGLSRNTVMGRQKSITVDLLQEGLGAPGLRRRSI